MKASRIIAAAAILAASLSVYSCTEEQRYPDPGLSVITDGDGGEELRAEDTPLHIEFDGERGSAEHLLSEGKITLSATPKAGYSFLGWYSSGDFDGEPLFEAEEYSLTETDLKKALSDGEIRLFARFERIYSLIYDLKGGGFAGVSGEGRYIPSDTEQPLAENAVREGYRFVGWRSSLDGKILTRLPARTEGDITLSAVWQREGDTSAFSGTAWAFDFADGFASGIMVFSPDGGLEIYSMHGSSGIYVNTGALLNMENRLYALADGVSVLNKKDLKEVKYLTGSPYYTYSDLGNKVEIIPTEALTEGNSLYARRRALTVGEVGYTVTLTGEGGAEMTLRIPEAVSYLENEYTAEEWEEYLMGLDTLPEKSEVEYRYTEVDAPTVMTKISDTSADLDFNTLTAHDLPGCDLSFGGDLIIGGSNVIVKRALYSDSFDGAFIKSGRLYVSSVRVDLYHIKLFGIHEPKTDELCEVTHPEEIEFRWEEPNEND